MKMMRKILAVGLVALPLAGYAQAADLEATTASDAQLWNAYVRGDFGMSFLSMKGVSDDSAFMYGGGVGYQFNPNFRADVTADWSNEYKVGGGNKLDATTLMGTAYYDFANTSIFTPYVGAGAGWAWTDGVSDDNGPVIGATAGVSVNLIDNLNLDVGYRVRDIVVSGEDPLEHQATAGLRFLF